MSAPATTGRRRRASRRLIALLEPALAATANVAADTLMAYVTGFVRQEKSEAEAPFPISAAELANRFPCVFRAVGADDEENFRAAVTAIVRIQPSAAEVAPAAWLSS